MTPGDKVLVMAMVEVTPTQQDSVLVSVRDGDNPAAYNMVRADKSEVHPLGRKVWVARETDCYCGASTNEVYVYDKLPVESHGDHDCSSFHWDSWNALDSDDILANALIEIIGPEHLPAPGECRAFYMPLIAAEEG